MKILDRLPFHAEPSFLTVGASTVEVRRYQIVVWVSLTDVVFPAVLDTGHSHNFTISQSQLRRFACLESLPIIGHTTVNRQLVPQAQSDLWLHGNCKGTKELSGTRILLKMDEGITLYPDGASGTPRLPLLGLRAIARNGLKVEIDGEKCAVTVRSRSSRW